MEVIIILFQFEREGIASVQNFIKKLDFFPKGFPYRLFKCQKRCSNMYYVCYLQRKCGILVKAKLGQNVLNKSYSIQMLKTHLTS